MDKQIVQYTYWLGVVSMALALVWRVLVMAGLQEKFLGLTYMSAYKGALLFFVTAIATTSYAGLKSQKT